MTSNRTVAHQNALSQVFKRTEFTLGVIIIVLFVLAGTLTKNFTSAYNLTNLTKQGSIVGVMAVAQTVIIITGGIDISGGAVAGPQLHGDGPFANPYGYAFRPDGACVPGSGGAVWLL